MKLKSLIAVALAAAVLAGTGCTPGGPSVCTVEQAWRCSDSALARLPQGELEPSDRAAVKRYLAGESR